VKTKKIILIIHLWLGFSSGIIVCFLGITGCILAFEQEIRHFTEPELFVSIEDRLYQPPSVIVNEGEKYLDGKKAKSIEYPGIGKSALVSYYDDSAYSIISVNPYTATVLKAKNMNDDFFRIVLNGHFYLWLPENIGQPIVASATLIFVIMMITGLILWWPKNKAARKQRFSIKWNARWRRLNYDLHNILGFYMTWIAVFIAVTGLVWGFQWFAQSVYWVSSFGKTIPEHRHPVSETSQTQSSASNVADITWMGLMKQAGPKESVSIYFPATPTDALEGAINHRPGTYYDTDYYHFDQYNGKELKATGIYAGKFKQASVADKINRMNYDIHVGAVLGLPGKILAFLASLIAASLPVTGFYIWWGRRHKKIAVSNIKPVFA
jgi:uncharacterized iron-regulated membrane protein